MPIHPFSLPDGYTARPASMDDVELTVTLINQFAKHHAGIEPVSVVNLRNEWNSPGYSMENDTQMVFNEKGNLVGYADCWDVVDPPVQPRVYLSILPGYENNGVGQYLLGWSDRRTMEAILRVDKELRVVSLVHFYSTAESMIDLVKAHGYQLIRHYFRMQIDMETSPPPPVWPEGIYLKPFDPERDMEAVYQADNEAFRDHFGFVEPSDYQQGYEDFVHYLTGGESYDPSLWFMAMDGDQIAGICICRKWANDDKECGFISSLGVRTPYRKRGLGLAFLHYSFGEFYRRGLRKAALGVDAQNLTGALRLYKKAGMHISRQTDEFEKEIRPGRDISVQALE